MKRDDFREPEYIRRVSTHWVRNGSQSSYAISGWKSILLTLLGLALMGLAAAAVVVFFLIAAILAVGNAVLGAIARPFFAWMQGPASSQTSQADQSERPEIIDAHFEVISREDDDDPKR